MSKKRIIIIITMALGLVTVGTSVVIVMNKNKAVNVISVEITSEELTVGNDVVKEKKDDIKKDDSNSTNETTDDLIKMLETTTEKNDTTTESNKKAEKKDVAAKSGNNKDTSINNESSNQVADSNKNNSSSNVTIEGLKPKVASESTTEAQNSEITTAPTTTESQKQTTTTAPTTTESPKPSTTQATATEKEKVWHEPVYEDVWVVDYPAYEAPVYEYHTVCNQCGLDFTATHTDIVAHQKASADEEGYEHCFSYTTGVSVLVGTETVPEVGHYEQKLVKDGYWE